MLKSVLIGAESTGKSTLAQALAHYYILQGYAAHVIPEYARTYVQALNRPYTCDDVLHIARQQCLEAQNAALTASPSWQADIRSQQLFFFDTDLIVTKIWLIDKYGTCPEWVDEALSEYKPDLYLVCMPDLPFEDDPVRENPHRREYLTNLYIKEIQSLSVSYVCIYGSGEQRLVNATRAITASSMLPSQ